jgi:hypothetical protein
VIQTHRSGAPREENAAPGPATPDPTSYNGSTNRRQFPAVDSTAVRRWGASLLEQAGDDVPLAGSPEWTELRNDDPRKRAAVVYAAISWCEGVSDLIDRCGEKQAAVVMAEMWKQRDNNVPLGDELRRRRADFSTARTVDPEAVARWVSTGSSVPTGQPTQEAAASSSRAERTTAA